MTFRLSQFAPYKNAVTAKVSGDWAAARIEFEQCVDAGRAAGGPPMICGLLFQLGDVEASSGNRGRALELYEEAMKEDPGSPLALITYAQSLHDVLGEKSAALEKLTAAESMLTSGEWIPSEDDLTAQQYTSMIASERARIKNGSDQP